MTTLEVVQRKLEKESRSAEATKVSRWLQSHPVASISNAAADVTVAEALRLWRVRLAVSKENNHHVEGLAELVLRLDALTRHKKVAQFGFLGVRSAATLLFEKSSGAYIGAALVEQIPKSRSKELS